MEFDIPKDQSSIIKVIGVGGGGGNAVNHMYSQGIKGVDFIVCNTDRQALDISPVPLKIQLGPSLTEGRGAGSIPEIGMNAVTENIDEIKDLLAKNAKMVFVTAGMGGGTGTGAAPVIARIAKEMGILTVGIVTVPFSFEGKKRRMQAEEGLQNMRDNVDTLLVINNERLREISGNLTLGNAFAQADDVLTTAAKGIAEVISVTGAINVDFNDVNTVMKDSGVAIMGSAVAEGENRAIKAVQDALSSPLLNDNNIAGAKYVLLNITYGEKEVLMDEISDITDYIQDEAGSTADVIWGHGYDEGLGESLSVTLIATGFNQSPITGFEKAPEKKVNMLEEQEKKEVTSPMNSPVKNSFNPSKLTTEEKEDEPFLKQNEASEHTKIEEKKEESTNSFDWEINTTKPVEDQDSEKNNEIGKENVEESLDTSKSTEESKSEKEKTEVKRYFLDDEVEQDVTNEHKESNVKLTPEDQQKRAQERLERIQKFTSRIKSAEGLSELEKQPAFVRRNIELGDTPHSSENPVSRLEVGKKDDKGDNSLRSTNSFLHDNVD